MMISICRRDSMPRFEPIGEPSGMTVAVPASCSRRASTGSALMYGSTVKPSRTSTSAARSVSTGSGKRYRGSGWISSFTQRRQPGRHREPRQPAGFFRIHRTARVGQDQIFFAIHEVQDVRKGIVPPAEIGAPQRHRDDPGPRGLERVTHRLVR